LHRAGLLDRLDVRAALADYEAAQADLQLEAAKRWPDLTLGPGYTLERDANRFTFVIGAVNLPLLDQNAGPIAEAKARREGKAAALLALQARVLSETDTARERYAGAAAELATAGKLIDAADGRVHTARRALELGAGDALDLALAVDELILVRHQRLEALGRAQSALGDLEDAVQRPLLAEGEDADALAGLLADAPEGAR
jgi:outer membrane protein TolC